MQSFSSESLCISQKYERFSKSSQKVYNNEKLCRELFFCIKMNLPFNGFCMNFLEHHGMDILISDLILKYFEDEF